jgi:hypothetical protein
VCEGVFAVGRQEPELTDCKTFEHGDASVELCNAGNKEWKDPKRGIRVSQVRALDPSGGARSG